MNFQIIGYWVIGCIAVIAIAVGGWFFFHLPAPAAETVLPGNGFGVGDTRTVTVTPTTATGGENTVVTGATSQQSNQKIFKVTDGPVTTATLIQTLHPTTTIARYVLQENGHIMDLVLDNSGVVARAISNTTIPGTAHGLWASNGNGALLQYLEGNTVKSLYVGLPAVTNATTTKNQAVHIQFLPDNVMDVSFSPDGKNIGYLLKSASGSDGYTIAINGSSSKKLFSTPLSELLLSWASITKMLLQTKSSAGVTGAAFSVNTQTGAVSPLVYAPGLTAIADLAFAHVVYQTRTADTSSYVHDTKTGKDKALSFSPIPEKCVWSNVNSSVMYCAAPLQFIDSSYLDQWHQGTASVPDAIFAFNVTTGKSAILAAPGDTDGGVASDIVELSVSPDDHYLLFIKKGDRSLWALRLQ
jgi:hypothetical protein